ncbi:hypothetical protein CSKR_104688 [Clonorchis sinensis]|uniref:Uncharacterized protein n=1 Tax=Clonorchis sinensis TaxID=79923 RepID=A0A419PLT0_CLOSI|nr:hypothetical protein CSKR_104688 [Clonorchis sinensis]
MHHWQPAIGQYWVMIGCWVQIFDQSDLGLMPDQQASRIPGQSCVGKSRAFVQRFIYIASGLDAGPASVSNSWPILCGIGFLAEAAPDCGRAISSLKNLQISLSGTAFFIYRALRNTTEFRRETLLIRLLKILRQPTTGFALLGAHQVGAVPEYPSNLCST